MRKFIYFLVFLLTPIFVFAESLMNWEGVFNGFYLEFLKSLFWFFKIAWPFLLGLIILKIVFSKFLTFLKNKKQK